MSDQKHVTWTDVEKGFTQKASRHCASRYRHWGVTPEDVQSEIYVWLFGEGEKKVRKWLSNTPQQLTRVYRSLLDVGIYYGECEKAERVGYHPDDTLWFTPKMVEAVMPLVLDDTYDGLDSSADENSKGRGNSLAFEGNDLLATVVDVRRALSLCPEWVTEVFQQSVPGGAGWDDAVQALINRLGGQGPSVARRRAISNSHAVALTHNQEAS